MQVTINGNKKEMPSGSTIEELIRREKKEGLPISISVNGTLKSSNEYATAILCEGDVIELVTFMGGG